MQTVSKASVTVDGEVVGSITDGLLVLVGVTHTDGPAQADALARKVADLRILSAALHQDRTQSGPRKLGPDANERSALELGAPMLVVSQFTLYGDTRKGRRPSWTAAAPAPVAEPLVVAFVEALRARGVHVETGRFRAHMLVESINVGPQTLLLDIN